MRKHLSILTRKHLSILTALVVLLVLGAFASKPSEAQTAPLGAGWYWVSVCGLYGPAAQQYCWLGQFAYIGAFTTQADCTASVTLAINTGNVLATWPYSPSTCFYMN